MGWALGFDKNWNRWIGYGVPALCDHPGCNEFIDRGLSYVCGSEPKGGEHGCGLYFCEDHRYWSGEVGKFVCEKCINDEEWFEPKPDVDEWVEHQATDPSWEPWRKENNVKTVEDIRLLSKQ